MNGTVLGFLGLIVVAATGLRWVQLIRQVAIPQNRAPLLIAFGAGSLLGLAGLLHGAGGIGFAAALLALIGGALMPALRLMSTQQPNQPAVAVGQPMLAFSAPDAEGNTFELASLAGKPYLLKFFRGHW